MPLFTQDLPLSLYVHIPWCVRKCPYCDFNSHEAKSSLPEDLYVEALWQEVDHHAPQLAHRPLVSIFFGGGTPSLFSAQSIERILERVASRLTLAPAIEITLEANPGTAEQARFRDFRHAGINRLSLGIQSLQNDKLKTLGRIHDRDTALRAVDMAQDAGFTNFNLDVMFGLPQQSIDDAMHDLDMALALKPTHFSWYQLTIEPNTLFHYQPPTLPVDDMIWEMQLAGQEHLQQAGFEQYEVSAYARPQKQCAHNMNYWEFGDYLGIGAGAHSKLTQRDTQEVVRFAQVKHPRDYLEAAKRQAIQPQIVAEEELIFEFMLNALRLTHGVPLDLFTQRTGIPVQRIAPLLTAAQNRGLLVNDATQLCPTATGKKFLNDLMLMFLPSKSS